MRTTTVIIKIDASNFTRPIQTVQRSTGNTCVYSEIGDPLPDWCVPVPQIVIQIILPNVYILNSVVTEHLEGSWVLASQLMGNTETITE